MAAKQHGKDIIRVSDGAACIFSCAVRAVVPVGSMSLKSPKGLYITRCFCQKVQCVEDFDVAAVALKI